MLTIKLDILPDYCPSCLIFLVQWHLNDLAINFIATHLLGELLKLLSLEIEPSFEDGSANFSDTLCDLDCYPHPDELLETCNISYQVGVQVVAV